MGDDDQRPVATESRDRLVDAFLGGAVQRARRLVEDQDLRIAQQRARDRDPLSLTSRELHSAVAEHRVVAVRELGDEVVGSCAPGGLDDAALVRVVDAKGDVEAHRVVEDEHILAGDPEATPERRRVELFERNPVDEHRTLLWVVVPLQNVDDRRFAGAGVADERGGLPARHTEAHVVECRRRLRVVAQGDTLERDLPRQSGVGRAAAPHERLVVQPQEVVEDSHELPAARDDRARQIDLLHHRDHPRDHVDEREQQNDEHPSVHLIDLHRHEEQRADGERTDHVGQQMDGVVSEVEPERGAALPIDQLSRGVGAGCPRARTI